MIELMLEPAVKKLCAAWKIAEDAAWWNVLRILKTWVIIFTGELFFRADTLGIGMHMFRSLFHDFSIQKLWDGTLLTLGLGRVEIGIILVSLLIVGVVNHFREQQIDVRGVTEAVASALARVSCAHLCRTYIRCVWTGISGGGSDLCRLLRTKK